MKIQKGKLSTSNAVVIGVLIVVLYLVMPAGSQKKQPKSESVSTQEPTQSLPQTKAAQEDSTQQNSNIGTTSESGPVSIADSPSKVNLRAIEEIDDDVLTALSGRNPFLTAVIAKDARVSPDETQAAVPEVRDSLQDRFAAHEQLKSSKISLIYSSSTGKKAAVLNDEIVYPGSHVAENFRVVTVGPNGLELRNGTAPRKNSP